MRKMQNVKYIFRMLFNRKTCLCPDSIVSLASYKNMRLYKHPQCNSYNNIILPPV